MSEDDLTDWDTGAVVDSHAEANEESSLLPVEEAPAFEPPALGGVSEIVTWWADATSSSSCAQLPQATLESNVEVVYYAEADTQEADAATATAAAITGLLTGRDAASTTTSFVNEDGLIDYDLWMRQCAATRDEMARLRSVRNDPKALRREVDEQLGPIVNRLTDPPANFGVLVDGDVATGAALLAYELNPEMLLVTRPLQSGETAVATIAWEYLRANPILPVRSNLTHGELASAAISLINNLVGVSRLEP